MGWGGYALGRPAALFGAGEAQRADYLGFRWAQASVTFQQLFENETGHLPGSTVAGR